MTGLHQSGTVTPNAESNKRKGSERIGQRSDQKSVEQTLIVGCGGLSHCRKAASFYAKYAEHHVWTLGQCNGQDHIMINIGCQEIVWVGKASFKLIARQYPTHN
jgi:hypothetical protein